MKRIGYLVRWFTKAELPTTPISIDRAEWFSSVEGANDWANRLIAKGFSRVAIEPTDVRY
jgi:hypothetical protein